MDTGKVLGNAVKSAAKGTGQFIREQREAQRVRTEERRAREAEAARIRAIQMAEAKDSYDKVMNAIAEHNSGHSYYRIVLAEDVKDVVQKCSTSTAFWDCEDPNCFWHAAEKEERGIGTPTRNFHPDFQEAEAPTDPITQLFGVRFER